MADGDVQIALPNGPCPTTKALVGQTAIRPKAVNGSFDGSGAAGAFLPCLVITGKEGFEVARIPAPQVAAGASAEVSWFPRVGGAAAVTATTAREVLQSNAATTIPGPGSDYLDWAHQGGASLLDLTHPKTPKLKAAGVYAITVTVGVSPLPVGGRYYIQLSATAADFPYVVQASGAAVASDPSPWTACTLTVELVKNALLRCYVFNYGSAPHDFGIFPAVVQRVS